MTGGPEWLDPVGDEVGEREAGSVQAALLTTYEPPDATVLLEDLLPRWFQLDRESSSDDRQNRLFLVELEAALQRRRGKLCVFSSNSALDAGSRHWIWSHVVPHRVGARGAFAQHAKLWLLHRVDENGDEWLDVHVSSTNLTRSALRDQVQGGFRYRVPLERAGTPAALESWGALMPFLAELGSHAGPGGVASVAPWRALLSRCRGPEGAAFVASVPGVHGSSEWGVRALGAALSLPTRGEVDILVPTIGEWKGRQIAAWAKAVGTRPERLGVAWIPKGHPWAKNWSLPESTFVAMGRAGVVLLDLGGPEADQRKRLHREFDFYDERWPHAKIYWFERGASQRVLVTSANWSPAAWGVTTSDGRLRIRNFELGVLLRGEDRPLQRLKEMNRLPATVKVAREPDMSSVWAHATFDGRTMRIIVRTSDPLSQRVVARDANDGATTLRVRWAKVGGRREAMVKRTWRYGPSVAIVEVNGIGNWITVQDLRDEAAALECPLSRPPGITEDELKRFRALLLEERYGGRLIDDDAAETTRTGLADNSEGYGTQGDYGVWVMEEGRRVLSVVDAWSKARADAESDALREVIHRDGNELLQLWRHECDQEASRRRVALVVACDELKARLRSPA